MFQSTRPHGTRQQQPQQQQQPSGFNPRARMGRDLCFVLLFGGVGCDVSIHAPAWDATYARAHGWDCWKFQSTRPHGTRLRGLRRLRFLHVSIHAPAWDATVVGNYATATDEFQSTRPHGTRLAFGYLLSRCWPFQSTRPHGTRPLSGRAATMSGTFQSTRPHGTRQ